MKRGFPPGMRGVPTPRRDPRRQYEDFGATELFCPKCRMATPVRKKLLLVLPTGDKYDYVCSQCGESVGSQMDTDPNQGGLLIP